MGPSMSENSVEGQFWGALKRANGDCDHRYTSGAPKLKCEHRSFEKESSLGDTRKSYAESNCLTQDGCLKFLFRMNIETPLVGLETCTHGTPQMPNPEAGSIRQEECSRHQHVEWNVIHGIQKGGMGNSTSPVFKLGTQMYCFELCVEFYIVKFHLYRLGRSVDGPAADARFWIGLKCRDGTYDHRNFSDKLDLSEELSLWTIVATKWFYLPDFENHYLTDYSRHSFFLRMNADTPGADLCMCNHGVFLGTSDVVAPEATGNIREEQCSSHKQVEWEIGYKVPQDRDIELASPVFKIATQAYFFETCFEDDGDVSVSLFRLGPSVRGSTSTPRYWVGVKRIDGIYDYEINSPQLNLHEDLGLWTKVDVLLYMDISAVGVKEKYLTSDSRLTFVFRMNTEPAGKQTCTHSAAEMSSAVTGRIREVGCSSHREVEWDIDYVPLEEKLNLTSPAFKIDTQMYFLEFFEDSFLLYRLGRSVEGPASSVRFWAGLKHPDGTYPLRNFSEKFDLNDDFELWTLATYTKDLPELDKDALKYIKRLTIFFRMNVESKGKEECIHGAEKMCPPADGSIREIKDNLVEWDVSYEERREYTHFSTSPVFKMGIQRYLLELCYEMDGILALSLYRFGRSVEVPVRCWAGLKLDRGVYHHNIEGVEFDLRTDCSLWTKVRILGYFRRCDLENRCLTKNGRLTFFCLINAEGRESKAAAVQTDGNREGGHEHRLSRYSEDFKKLRQDFRSWLEHPEEGDRIRRRRREEFEAKRWNALEKQLKEDTEHSIFAA